MRECGRSMVEMLGVLAIIGVLSVGAMTGYSKAMFKYKLNKQAEQLNTVLNAAARNALSFNNLNTGLNVTEYFVKMGEIPIEMVKDTSQSGCIYDAFNTQINIVYNVYPTYNRLIVTISPQLDIMNTENLEICRNILSVSKENSSNIYRLSVVSSYGDEDQAYLTIYGDISCTQGNLCFKNLSLDNIYELCTSAIGKQEPHIKIIWQNSLVR